MSTLNTRTNTYFISACNELNVQARGPLMSVIPQWQSILYWLFVKNTEVARIRWARWSNNIKGYVDGLCNSMTHLLEGLLSNEGWIQNVVACQ